jgi:hypothetical protein
MKYCDQELVVAKAIRTGHWSQETEAHLAACPTCKTTAQAARWMQSFAQQVTLRDAAESRRDAGATAVRDASLLWCKALLDQKAAEARSARRRLAAMEWGSAAFVGLLLAGWVRWNWAAIEASLSDLAASLIPQAAKAVAWILVPEASGASLSATFLLVLGGAAALLASYPLLSEE